MLIYILQDIKTLNVQTHFTTRFTFTPITLATNKTSTCWEVQNLEGLFAFLRLFYSLTVRRAVNGDTTEVDVVDL